MLNQAAEGEVSTSNPLSAIRQWPRDTPSTSIRPSRAPGEDPPHYASVEAIVTALSPSDPVFCINAFRNQACTRRFASSFPGRVLYAVKCNPHPFVLETLYRAGVTIFDAASLMKLADDSLFGKAAGTYF